MKKKKKSTPAQKKPNMGADTQSSYEKAALLWEEQTPCDKPVYDYIRYLFLAKQYQKAVTLLIEPTTILSETEKRQLNEYLAAILLIDDLPDIEALLPPDSTLLTHKALIKQAIIAYCQGNDPRDYLKQIPFRSHYRELRVILQASYEGKEFTISQHSVYIEFAPLLRIHHTNNAHTFINYVRTIPQQSFTVLGKLYHWSPEQLSLLKQLAKVDTFTPKQLLSLILNNVKVLGDTYSQNAGIRLLPLYKDGIKQYQSQFTLSTTEVKRIHALSAEQRQNFDQAAKAWIELNNLLLTEEVKDDYQAAIILRHLVELIEQTENGPFHDSNCIELLVNSLRLDPTDKPSYLKLIHYFQRQEKQKEYQLWVKNALEQFPNDVEILLLGTKAAIANKTFKKASSFAKTILKHDSINVTAKKVLLFCHLSQAYKQVKAQKYHLAQQELMQAEKIERTHQSGIVQVNQGWLAVVTNQPQQAHDYFMTALQYIKEPFSFVIYLTIEGKNMKLEQQVIEQWIKKITTFKQSAQLTTAAITQAIEVFYQYHEQQLPNLSKLIQPFANLLSKNSQNYHSNAPKDIREICRKLTELKLFPTLKMYATQGLKSYPTDPLLLYYQIIGEIENQPLRLMLREDLGEVLEHALEYAQLQNDKQAQWLLINLLNKLKIFSSFSLFGEDDG